MELRDYQSLDVQKILANQTLGIFSEQRTGKTPTAIVGMTQKCKRILIICPNSLVYNWSAEVERWVNKPVTVITKQKIPAHVEDIVIVNYDKIANTKAHKGLGPELIKLKFEGLIIDEAHRIKNRNAAVSQAIISMAHKIPHRLALTGTPAHDKPEDVFNILRFLDPKTFRSYWNFVDTWCSMSSKWTPRGMVKEPSGIDPSKKKIFAAMLNNYAIMHKRTEVMNWETEQDIVDIKLPLNATQLRYLNGLEKYFECTDGTSIIEPKNVLERLVRYRQICNAPAVCNLKGKSPKIDWIKEYIKSYGNAVIIFSNSKRFLDVLYKELATHYIPMTSIDGTCTPKERAKAVKDFQDGYVNTILIQTQAGKEGLTLDRADATIFCDVYPPASDYMQAKDRAVPTSPEKVKSRTVYRLMMNQSFDETLYTLVDSNINASDVINNFINYIGGSNNG